MFATGIKLVVQNRERQKNPKTKTKVLETTQFSSVTNRAKVLGPHKHRAHRPRKKNALQITNQQNLNRTSVA